MGKGQSDSVFVFDEPTIGLHPLDVRTLMEIFQKLVENGATVIVIEHDLDVIRNADYIIDMGSRRRKQRRPNCRLAARRNKSPPARKALRESMSN